MKKETRAKLNLELVRKTYKNGVVKDVLHVQQVGECEDFEDLCEIVLKNRTDLNILSMKALLNTITKKINR